MGFDSIYQDWKEKGLFVKRLRIQHRKINPMEKPFLRWLAMDIILPALALAIMCGGCWVCLPHRLDGLSIRKHCHARSPSYSHRDKSHLRIMETDMRTTWMVVSLRKTLELT